MHGSGWRRAGEGGGKRNPSLNEEGIGSLGKSHRSQTGPNGAVTVFQWDMHQLDTCWSRGEGIRAAFPSIRLRVTPRRDSPSQHLGCPSAPANPHRPSSCVPCPPAHPRDQQHPPCTASPQGASCMVQLKLRAGGGGVPHQAPYQTPHKQQCSKTPPRHKAALPLPPSSAMGQPPLVHCMPQHQSLPSQNLLLHRGLHSTMVGM